MIRRNNYYLSLESFRRRRTSSTTSLPHEDTSIETSETLEDMRMLILQDECKLFKLSLKRVTKVSINSTFLPPMSYTLLHEAAFKGGNQVCFLIIKKNPSVPLPHHKK